MEEILTVQGAKAMKVSDLKAALQDRGLATDGLKSVLLARLIADIEKVPAEAQDSSDNQNEAAEAVPDGHSTGVETAAAHSSVLHDTDSKVATPPAEAAVTALDDTTPAASMSVEHSAQANQHNIDNAAPELTEEERLRELVKLRMKRKVSAEVSGDRSSANKVVVPSKHLRIDNFQRPLNQKSLTEFLTIKLGVSFVDGDIWLNGIKTHCYVDFSDVESATQAKAHLEGERWPTTNPKPLEVSYTSVSAKDAPTSAEAAMRPGEWHKACAVVVSKTANDCTPESGAESVLGKRKIEPTSAAMSMFKNAIAGANTVGSGANRARDVTTLQRLEGSTDTGFSTRRSAETGIISENSGPKQLGLDDLFCKTMSKPQLYWLPLTEDEVARKKMAKSKAESDPLRG